jgi:hypothetical protein
MQQQRGPVGAHQALANQRNNAASSTRGHVGARHAVGLGRQPYNTTFSSSPGGHGTLHFGPSGSHGMASGGQAAYAAFAAGHRGSSTAPRTQGCVPHAQSTLPRRPGGPDQATRDRIGTMISEHSAASKAHQRAVDRNSTLNARSHPPPMSRAQGNAPRGQGQAPKTFNKLMHPSHPAPKLSTMEKQEQKQKDDLVSAAKAGNIGDKMVRSQGDFPGVATLKLLIIDGAIDHSNPSGPVLRMHSEYLNVYHATRVWLLDLAFYLAGLDDDNVVNDKLEITRATVSQRFESDLYKVVKEAMEDVATKPHDALKLEYRLAGKLDILETAIALHLSEAPQNGKLPFQSDLNIQKTDTIITAEPTVNETEVTTSDAVVAPPAESEATALVLLVENLDVDMLDVATDVATNVEVPTLSVDDTGVVSNNLVGDEDVPGAANVTDDNNPTAQPAAVVATQDVPGTAALHFSDGTREFGPLIDALPPGLIVNVFMTFDSDHEHLKNEDIYLGAFSEMVAAFHRRVNDAKAAEHDGDSDAAAESDDSTHTGASGFGTDASYKIVRSPAAQYTGDTSDSDESL